MAIWKSINGLYYVEITSADPAKTLSDINALGITLMNVVYVDELSVRAYIYRHQFCYLKDYLEKRGVSFCVLKRKGIYWSLTSLTRRPVLIVGLTFILFLSLYLPTKVLFIEVSGNRNIPTAQILERADQCGIKFGASRRAVRSEKMKNALLAAVPQLQWAGINTKGCVAVISVRERSEQENTSVSTRPSSIIARQDGVIHEITVLKGTPLCKVGQAVKKDQVLISGYTDCGLAILVTPSEAEVSAYTSRDLQAITPTKYSVRSVQQGKRTTYALKIGKNIINLWKDSGISDTGCVKITQETPLCLPGGFVLPIVVIRQQYYDYALDMPTGNESDFSWLSKAAEDYVNADMVAGRILKTEISTQSDDDAVYLSGKYACLEMIGQIRYEEIVESGEGN